MLASKYPRSSFATEGRNRSCESLHAQWQVAAPISLHNTDAQVLAHNQPLILIRKLALWMIQTEPPPCRSALPKESVKRHTTYFQFLRRSPSTVAEPEKTRWYVPGPAIVSVRPTPSKLLLHQHGPTRAHGSTRSARDSAYLSLTYA